MAQAISFSGLSSGIDTGSIVDALMALERAPVTAIEQRKTREGVRSSNLTELQTRLKTLRTTSDAIRDPVFWAGVPKAVSGDDDAYDVAATSGAAKASYRLQVKQLASAAVMVQSTTSGVRQFGSSYMAGGAFATGTTKLADLNSSGGSGLGLTAGQTITLNGTQGGTPITSTFTVTATSTIDNLKSFVESAVPGSKVTLESGGRITVRSPVGTDREITPDLSLSTGGGAPLFDAAFASSSAIVSATGIGNVQADDTIHLVSGTLAWDVNVTAGMSMAQVASAINGSNGGISAAVVGGQLRLAGKDTGAANTISMTSDGALAAQLGLSSTVTAQDAIVSIDGVDRTSASNATDDLIPGATVTLKRTTTVETTATTDPTYVDQAEARTRMQKLVDDYNAVVGYTNIKSSEKRILTPKTDAERNQGTLFGSTLLAGIRSNLQLAVTSSINGLVAGKNLPSDMGLSTGAIGAGVAASTGQLIFDPKKFDEMFTGDLDGLKQMLGTDGGSSAANGIALRLSKLAEGLTKSTGQIQAAIDGSTASMKTMTAQVERMNDRLVKVEARLKAQFTAMESAMAQLTSQGNAMSSAIAGLNAQSS